MDFGKMQQSRAFPGARNTEVHSRCFSAVALWHLGAPDQAQTRIRECLMLVRELAYPDDLAAALTWAATLHQLRRERHTVSVYAEEAATFASEYELPYWNSFSTILRGWALVTQGQGDKGVAQLRQGLEMYRATGAELGWPYFLSLLAEAYNYIGQKEQSMAVVEEAIDIAKQHGERLYEAELYRMKGEFVLSQIIPDVCRVESYFRQALDIALHQEAKSLELRAATSLARLWQQQGKRIEAYELLTPIYGWFTEGFDTADLQEAKTLLEALT